MVQRQMTHNEDEIQMWHKLGAVESRDQVREHGANKQGPKSAY